jgi:hypothetical protein
MSDLYTVVTKLCGILENLIQFPSLKHFIADGKLHIFLLSKWFFNTA